MEECGGVRITFPPGDSKSDEVKLHGPRPDVEKAKAMLLECVDEQSVNHQSFEIRCKPGYHRFLIGRGGANIRKVSFFLSRVKGGLPTPTLPKQSTSPIFEHFLISIPLLLSVTIVCMTRNKAGHIMT